MNRRFLHLGLDRFVRIHGDIEIELSTVDRDGLIVRGMSSIGERSCEVSTSRSRRPDNHMTATVAQYRGGRSDDKNDYARVHSC